MEKQKSFFLFRDKFLKDFLKINFFHFLFMFGSQLGLINQIKTP